MQIALLSVLVLAVPSPYALGDENDQPDLNDIADVLVDATAAVAVDAVDEHLIGEDVDEKTKRVQRDAMKILLDPRQDRSEENLQQLMKDVQEAVSDASGSPSSLPRTSAPAPRSPPPRSRPQPPKAAQRPPPAVQPGPHTPNVPGSGPQVPAVSHSPIGGAASAVTTPDAPAGWGGVRPWAAEHRRPQSNGLVIAAVLAIVGAAGLSAAVAVVALRRNAPARPSMHASLHARGLPNIRVSSLPFLLGRAEGCHVRIDDPQVSGVHARLEETDGVLVLHDCDSRNGTYLNDRRLKRPAKLATGDTIRLGRTEVGFRYDKQA